MKKKSQIKLLFGLISPLLLSACLKESYPQVVKNELLSTCMEGILSGQTPVANKKFEINNVSKTKELCEYRLNEFMKTVSYSSYEQYRQHLYENFDRAYQYKYVISDIYKTLSPNDKKVFETVSLMILGLDTEQTEKTQHE